ncbi:MAG: tetratricopeptide repeat protein [Asticcacaulis sp.]
MKTLLASAAAVSLLCLSAPALAGAAPYTSAYGDYLVGRMAAAGGDTQTAGRALMAAADADPENATLRERAFLAAMMNGDMGFALSHLPQTGGRLSQALSLQAQAVSAVRQNRSGDIKRVLAASEKAAGSDRTLQLLRPLLFAADGQWNAAIDADLVKALGTDATIRRDKLVTFLQAVNQAQLLERKGRNSEAEEIYALICQPGPSRVLFGPYFGAFLERRGRKDEARALYTEILSASEDRLVRRRLAALDAPGYRKPAKPEIRLIMAESLFLSGTLYASEQQAEMALTSLRLAQFAAPEKPEAQGITDRARLLAGQVLIRLRDIPAAQQEWASVEPSSPFYTEAQTRAAWAYKESADLDAAYEIFTALGAASPQDAGLVVERARILWQKDDTAGGLKLLDDYVAAYGDKTFDWQTWFSYAVLQQAAGDWEKTKVSAKRGLELQPESPELLNLLGYGMIDRGENVDDGMEMIRKALKSAPRSGAIMDSLGWGYYKQGKYAEALEWVEKAIALEPADPEITEHLGDVYLKLGRGVEAKYQWARVLTLEADDTQKASVQAKLDAAAKADQARDAKAVADAAIAPPVVPAKKAPTKTRK